MAHTQLPVLNNDENRLIPHVNIVAAAKEFDFDLALGLPLS